MDFITPVDIGPGTTGSWQDADVSSHIPAGATGVVLHIGNATGFPTTFGFRKNGSSDSRTGGMYYGRHAWCTIGVDSNRILELYTSKTTTPIWLVGYYTDDATFFTNATNKSLSSTASWIDIDISSDTGANTAIGALFEVRGSGDFGLRKNGSTDNRKEATTGYYCPGAVIGVDASEICEGYISSTNVDFFLVGYIETNSTFNTNGTYFSGGTGSYSDVTIDASAIGAYIEVYDIATYDDYAVRKNGSSEDIYGIADNHPWAIVEADASGVIEAKRENSDVRFYYVGYPTAGGAEHTQTCSDSVAFAITIKKDVNEKKAFSFSIAESKTTTSEFSISKAEILNYVTTIAHDNSILLSDTVQLVESLVKSLGISYSDAFSFAEDISKLVTFNKLFSRSLSIAEDLSKEPNVIMQLSLDIIESSSRETGSQVDISDLVAFTVSLSKTLGITKQEAFTIVDSTLTVLEAIRTNVDTLTLTESLQKVIGLSEQETLAFVESLSIAKTKKVTEVLTLAETLTTQFGLSASSAIALADSFTTQSTYSKTFSEVLELIENIQKLYSLSKIEAIGIIDAMSSVSGSTQSLSDILLIVESRISQASILNQETLNIAETSMSIVSFSRVLSDILILAETSQLHQEKPFSETLSFIDSLQAVAGNEKSLSDTLSIAATYSQLTGKNISDTLSFVETVIKQINILQQDETIIAEIIKKTIDLPITSTLIIAEEMSTSLGELEVDISETIQITDKFDRHLVYSAIIIETIALAEVLIKQYGLSKEEALSIAETHSYTKTTDVTTERLGRRTILTTNKNKTLMLVSKTTTILTVNKNKTTLPMV